MTSEAISAAGIPPQGVRPNFVNPPSLYPPMLATVVLCSSLTTLFTFARLFTKWAISAWALEDHLLMLAWALNVAYDCIFLVQGRAGTGRHIWDIRALDMIKLAKFQWISSNLYSPTMWLAKTALLLQLRQIFAPMRTGSIYWAIHVLIWGNLAFYISTWLTIIFQCIPQEKIWNPEYKGGHCTNYEVSALVTSIVNVMSDFLILLLPLVAIWRLYMAPKRKVGVSAVFATGLLAFTSSIVRLAYTIRFFTSRDVTYIGAQVGMWTLAELATVILVTCFPVMPRFAQLIHSRLGPSRDTEAAPLNQAGRNIPGGATTPLGLPLTNGSEAFAKRGDAVAPAKNLYIPLGEHEDIKTSRPYRSARHGGIQRTVSIELTSRVSSG